MKDSELAKTRLSPVDPGGVEPDISDELDAVGLGEATEIGRGGFGVVYRCTEAALDRIVAVKVLTVDLDENRARFLREQKAMGRLTGHPNIVPVLRVGETDGHHLFLVMPYYAQGSLAARLRRLGPLSLDEVLSVGVKIAGALDAAHREQILHRDVKPGNILLTDYGEPALCDFGIAHISGGFETRAGEITASPAFTAPEILLGKSPTEACDVYGLGSTLFCALTGHAAFERRTEEGVVTQFLRITEGSTPDLRGQGIPGEVAVVIETAMSPTPEQRPSMAAFGERLREIQHGHNSFGSGIALSPAEVPPTALVRAQSPGSAHSATRRLTPQLTSFVGRRKLLSVVEKALSKSRLVTLAGIGGTGKTRIAVQAASHIEQKFADGVRVVEIGELGDPEMLVEAVSLSVGVPNQAGGATRDALIEYLSTREFLLVFDNCESAVEMTAQLVESLLLSCPRLVILATSRETLRVGGELVVTVGPLEFPDPASSPSVRELAKYDAVRLFIERGTAAFSGFKLSESNRICIARICARLEGLPLAIELAAARLRTMSVDQILQRLDDRFALLTHGDRGAAGRQRTLQACMDWSYDLCTPDEQQLWAQLSVFAGGFEFDAVEGICGASPGGPELLDTLAALVEKSILRRDSFGGVSGFRMLDTVRDYGSNVLEESGRSQLYQRYRDWYQNWVSETERKWIGPGAFDQIARLTRELPNLRQVLELDLREADNRGLRSVAVLYPFWMSGLLREGRAWLKRMLAHSSGAAPLDRAKALYSATSLAVCQGDLSETSAPAAELRGLAGEAQDAQDARDGLVAAFAAAAEGLAGLSRGDLASAITQLERAVEALSESSDQLVWQVSILLWLGFACDLKGDTDRALTRYREVLAITEPRDETTFRSWALWQVGVLLCRTGEFTRAVEPLLDGLRLTRRIRDPLVTTFILEALAWIAAEQLDAERAAVLMGAAGALSRATGSATVPFPNLLVYHEACEQRAREALNPAAFEAALREGGSMGLDAAASFALGERHPSSHRRHDRDRRHKQPPGK